MVRVRKDVWSLGATDKTLYWYGQAVAAMKAKPIADPTSWRYQAAIHDYDAARDPLADPNDVLPTKAEQNKFWSRCQHSSWFFLPWHRMYLHHFEKIVAAEIEKLGGPADWALPYWNYSNGDDSRLLPPAFIDPASPLYVEDRSSLANEGKPFADAYDADVNQCLAMPDFEGASFGGDLGFGGPSTLFHHGGGPIGAIESIPHGSMHGAVGGWMGAFNTAGLDPLFWLHHCNIDRLWEVWLKQPNRQNPTAAKWKTGVKFKFHDATGAVVTMTSSKVIDTTALDYTYTLPTPVTPFHAMLRTPAMAKTKKRPPEMVGATRAAFTLDGGTTHATFAHKPPKTKPKSRVAAMAAVQAPPRVFLNIENLEAADRAPAYDVYINVPDGDDPKNHKPLWVGRIPLFGIESASGGKGKQRGLSYSLDITNLYAHLSALPGWDPDNLRVSFVASRKAGATVKVGRVSLYFQ